MLGIDTLSFLAGGSGIVGIVGSARLWALKAAGLSGVAPQGGDAFTGLVTRSSRTGSGSSRPGSDWSWC